MDFEEKNYMERFVPVSSLHLTSCNHLKLLKVLNHQYVLVLFGLGFLEASGGFLVSWVFGWFLCLGLGFVCLFGVLFLVCFGFFFFFNLVWFCGFLFVLFIYLFILDMTTGKAT